MASRSSITAARSVLSRAAASPSTVRASTSTLARSAVAVGSIRAFSKSIPKFAALEGDAEFSTTIAEELKYESENSPSETASETADLLKKAGWQVEDKAGSDLVIFTKKIDNEIITASFRISDISDAQPPAEQDEETPEEEEDEDMPEGSAPQVTITVTKPTSAQGSLVFTTYVEEGTFSIENVSLYDEIVDVTKESAETEYKKDAAYGGPTFDNLDPTIQDHFDSFLESRGINSELAEIVQEYQISKEQKEYVSWLKNVKAFIDL